MRQEDGHTDEHQRDGRDKTAEQAHAHDDGEHDGHGRHVHGGDDAGEDHGDLAHGHEVAEHARAAEDCKGHADRLAGIVEAAGDDGPA